MDTLIQALFDHAQHAHWIVFGTLVLSGCGLPVSEDLVVIFSAVVAALVIPENMAKLFLGVFCGCYLSDWIAYSLGRRLGPRLWNFRWFSRIVKKKKMDRIQKYYSKYGFWTLLVGRFIPFGGRSCLLVGAGLGKMHKGKFAVSDGIACLCSNTVLFSLAFTLSKNYETLLSAMKTANIFLFSAFLVSIIAFIWYKRKKKASI